MSNMKTVVSGAVQLMSSVRCAREFRGTIGGRVVDPQGAVIPSVKIQSVQKETGAKSNTVSSGDSQFAMTPGHYEVTAESAGFKRYVRTNLQVETNERLTLDITLEVGQAAESVMVTSVRSVQCAESPEVRRARSECYKFSFRKNTSAREPAAKNSMALRLVSSPEKGITHG